MYLLLFNIARVICSAQPTLAAMLTRVPQYYLNICGEWSSHCFNEYCCTIILKEKMDDYFLYSDYEDDPQFEDGLLYDVYCDEDEHPMCENDAFASMDIFDDFDGDYAYSYPGSSYSSGDPNPMPSKCVSQKWICTANTTQRNNRPATANKGKWMIFRATEEIDSVWQKISTAVKDGKLGPSADVSTIGSKTGNIRIVNNLILHFDSGIFESHAFLTSIAARPSHVICVNTYDHTDQADVLRVRNELRSMGFIEKLPYKTDAATKAQKTDCKYRC